MISQTHTCTCTQAHTRTYTDNGIEYQRIYIQYKDLGFPRCEGDGDPTTKPSSTKHKMHTSQRPAQLIAQTMYSLNRKWSFKRIKEKRLGVNAVSSVVDWRHWVWVFQAAAQLQYEDSAACITACCIEWMCMCVPENALVTAIVHGWVQGDLPETLGHNCTLHVCTYTQVQGRYFN